MQEAIRNRELNHLLRDLPLPAALSDFQLQGLDESKVRKVFGTLEFRTLTERVLKLRGIIGGTEAGTESSAQSTQIGETTVAAEVSDASTAASFELPPEPASERVNVAQALEWAIASAPVAVELEFANGKPFSIGLANASKRVIAAVVAQDEVSLANYLAGTSSKILFGAKDTERRLIASGMSLANVSADPLLLAYLIDPLRRSYALDDLSSAFLHHTVSRGDENALIPEAGVDLSLNAWIAFLLADVLWPQVEEQDQEEVYLQVESPSSSTLARMEAAGIKVDASKLNNLLDTLTTQVADAEKACFDLIGKEINLASPKQLQAVLFEDLGMTGNKKVKTGFSTNAESLNTLFEETGHPFLAALLKHREVTKIRQMVEILLKAIAADGRIHTNYVQTGTSTGRLSSEGPNLQNIPIKTEQGREIRDSFVVGDGFETLLTADYSQIEMRIMAHLSEDAGLIEAFNTGEDLHRFVGARIFGVKPDEVSTAMRSKVKAMSYGLVYGLSEYGLAKQLRISNGEAKQLMTDYFDRFGGVRRYLAQIVDHAKLNGYTATSLGRRRPFDDLKSPIFQIRENARRAALNAPIQGTAADIMKLAMIQIDHAIIDANLKSRMLLQVHDELVFEVAPGELEQLKAIVIDRMSNAVKLSVPLDVHVGVGSSWDKAGH